MAWASHARLPITRYLGALLDGRTVELTLDDVPLRARVAGTDRSGAQGLRGTPSLDDMQGMLFIHSSRGVPAYWMKGVAFAIDMIWIDGDEVIDVTADAHPPSVPGGALTEYRPPAAVDKVIEVRAGWTKAHGIDRGSRLEIRWLPIRRSAQQRPQHESDHPERD